MKKASKSSAKFICAVVSSLLVLSACAQGIGNLQPARPGVEQANSKVHINNDPASLAAKLIRKNQPVPIKKDGFATQADADSVHLTLVAEVLPPTVGGKVVQATNVYEKDNIAYVSYDVAGDEYAGGVYIIDINDPHHPVLLAEMTLDGTDFYSVTAKGDHLYLPGATKDEGFDSPAMLQTMKLAADGHSFAGDLGRLGLPSYAATDVATSFNHVFVSTGDVGGGIVRIDGTTLQKTGFYPMFDARSVNMDYLDVAHDEGLLTVFRGQPGEMDVLGSDLTLRKTIDLHAAASIPVSSRFWMSRAIWQSSAVATAARSPSTSIPGRSPTALCRRTASPMGCRSAMRPASAPIWCSPPKARMAWVSRSWSTAISIAWVRSALMVPIRAIWSKTTAAWCSWPTARVA